MLVEDAKGEYLCAFFLEMTAKLFKILLVYNNTLLDTIAWNAKFIVLSVIINSLSLFSVDIIEYDEIEYLIWSFFHDTLEFILEMNNAFAIC